MTTPSDFGVPSGFRSVMVEPYQRRNRLRTYARPVESDEFPKIMVWDKVTRNVELVDVVANLTGIGISNVDKRSSLATNPPV